MLKFTEKLFLPLFLVCLSLLQAFEIEFNSTATAATTCNKSGLFCGNNGLSMDPNNLYKCTAGYVPSVI